MAGGKIDFFLLGDLNDIDKCIKWCQDMGLLGKYYICPVCKGQMKWTSRADVQDKYTWRCRDKTHDMRRSIRTGTWFSNSHLSLIKILWLTHLWCSDVASTVIEHNIGVCHSTIVDWKSFCREVCVNLCDNNDKLGGIGSIVEIDESKFGKRKYNRGRFVDGKWVFGGIQRGTDKCFFKVVDKRDKETLLTIIKEKILPGTTIISDCWKSYDCLESEGFQHLTVNHSINFRDPETGAHTNAIEGTWGAIKRKLTARNCTDQFDAYLAEYVWRRQQKHSVSDMTSSFFEVVARLYKPQTED